MKDLYDIAEGRITCVVFHEPVSSLGYARGIVREGLDGDFEASSATPSRDFVANRSQSNEVVGQTPLNPEENCWFREYYQESGCGLA